MVADDDFLLTISWAGGFPTRSNEGVLFLLTPDEVHHARALLVEGAKHDELARRNALSNVGP
eukprot:scaffold3129_cov35-Tisochrysis_lutea.AAC.2